jgi:hypothetical protein
MRLTVSVLLATTDSIRSLAAIVIEVEVIGADKVDATVMKVSSSLGAAQLAARTTAGSANREYRINDLDMSASADAGIANSDVDEMCMWILPKMCKFQKSAVGF